MTEWFLAGSDHKPRGPLDTESLIRELGRLQQPLTVPIWKAGFADWIRAGEVAEIAARLGNLPPPLKLHHFYNEPPPRSDDLQALEFLLRIFQPIKNIQVKGIWFLVLFVFSIHSLLFARFGPVVLPLKIVDPIILVPALILGLFVSRWWYIPIFSTLIGFLQESLLVGIQLTRQFDVYSFLVAVNAATLISTLAHWCKGWWEGRGRVASTVIAPDAKSIQALPFEQKGPTKASTWNAAGATVGGIMLWSTGVIMLVCVAAVIAVILSR